MSLFDPRVLANPFPFYQYLRHQAPVHFEESIHFWLISKYADVHSVLKSKQVTAKNPPIRPMNPMSPETAAQQASVRTMIDSWVNFLETSDHRPIRSLINKGFLPRMVQSLQPRIKAMVHELLDQVSTRSEMDLTNDFAYPLALNVIGELIGVPEEARPRVKEWAGKIIAYFNDVTYSDSTAIANMESVRLEMGAYMEELIELRRENSGDDFLSTLVLAMGEEKIDRELLVNNLIFLLFAGHETTVNLIGNGVKALLDFPAEYEKLQQNHDLVPLAVEEFLRFGTPSQLIGRVTTGELEVGGVVIGAGQPMMLLLASANRDESVFENADQLDITRNPNNHLGFGHGAHFCLGAPLARLEAAEAFKGLLERCPGMRLNGEPELNYSLALRGFKKLPIAWG